MKNQITLSLITAAILGLNGCGGDSAKSSTPQSEASSLIQANSSVALENQASLEVAVNTALEKNTNRLKANGLLEKDAKQESKKFTSAALGKLNLDELEAAIFEECKEDEKCKEEAYVSFTGALTEDKEESYAIFTEDEDKEESYAINTGSLILDKEEAYAIAQDFREDDKEEAYAILVNDGLVKEFTCEAGEVKTVRHYGIEDVFDTTNGTEATTQRPAAITQGMINYNNNVNSGFANYDETNNDRQFLDDINNLPTGVTSGRFYIGLKSNGSSLQINDTISLGDMSQVAANRFSEPLTNLSSLGWSNQLVSSTNPTTDIYWNDLSNISLGSQTLLAYVKNNQRFDAYVQDDTSVDFITVATCSKPNPIKEVTAIVNKFECNEKEGDLLKISGGVIDAFAPGDDPTTPSATLTSNSPTMDYDNPAHDRHLIDTLNLGLTTSQIVTKAEFHVGYKSTNRSMWTNDALYLGEVTVNHAGFKLYSNVNNNFIENTWNINTVNGETIASTDLGLNNTVGTGTVFDTMVNNGFLDIYVQDDTTVDFTQLNLCVKDNCDESAKDIKVNLSQLASWTTSATDVNNSNPIPTVWDNTMNWFNFTSKEPNGERILKIPFCACSNTIVNINSLKADNNATIHLDSNLIVTQNAAGQASMRADNNGGINASGSFTQPANVNGPQNHTLTVKVNNQSSYFGVAIDGTLSFKGNLGKCQ